MDKPDPKYFDYAASVPPFREVLDSFIKISQIYFANPSSIHSQGRKAKKLLFELKKEFCDLLHFYDGRLMLCSSATEANNTIIEGCLRRFPEKKILIAEDAHDSVWYAINRYPKRTSVLKINPNGKIDEDQLIKSLSKDTVLVCLNHVCSETGTIHNVDRLAYICQSREIKILIDGTQAIGHIPLNLNDIPCDYYTFSAHKFGGLRSSGGIFMRTSNFEPLLFGGMQEWEMRGGTENLAGLAAAKTALKRNLEIQSSEMTRLNTLGQRFTRQIREKIPVVIVNSPQNGLPGLISISVPGMKGNEIVAALSLSGYSLSTGSACHANHEEPSRIILARGLNDNEATGTVRISMGYGTTEESLDGLLKAILEYIS
jgi:cysteine desulfurase